MNMSLVWNIFHIPYSVGHQEFAKSVANKLAVINNMQEKKKKNILNSRILIVFCIPDLLLGRGCCGG